MGVYLVAGCGADVLINICLTILGYFPGHSELSLPVSSFRLRLTEFLRAVHAFYLEYVYFNRRDKMVAARRAPGIYSENVQSGGTTYGTVG